jgi:hypothetical protein
MKIVAKTVEADNIRHLDVLINEIGSTHKIISVALATTLEKDVHLGRNITTYTATVLYQ